LNVKTSVVKQFPYQYNIEFSKNILINLIKDNRIPDQIMNDCNFKDYIKDFSNDSEKVADALIKLYDIVIMPSSQSQNRPNTSKSTSLSQNKRWLEAPKNKIIINNSKEKSSLSAELFQEYLSGILQPKLYKETQKNMSMHPINIVINLINQLCQSTIRNKNANYDMNLINNIYKNLGLQYLMKTPKISYDNLKSKDFYFELKGHLLKILSKVINKENEISIEQMPETSYKFCILNGNNSNLIKTFFRQRSWWSSGNEQDEVNLIWSQWNKTDFIGKLKKVDVKVRSNNENKCIELIPQEIKLSNHLEFNYVLGNKKCMYYNLKFYYQMINKEHLDIMPLTFHVRGILDPEYENFKKEYLKNEEAIKKNQKVKHKRSTKGNSEKEFDVNSNKNIWIIKPGENTNRGNGINVSNKLQEIEGIIKRDVGKFHTFIIQKYIENPLLINKRKFDIRCFGLFTSVNGYIKG